MDMGKMRGRARDIVLLIVGSIVAFLVVNYIHFQFIPVRVILFACLVDGAVAIAIVWGAYLLLRSRDVELASTEIVLTILTSALAIAVYSVMGPTVIDRSLSIYIVEKVDQRGGQVAQAAMPAIFIEEYMPEYRLVDVRLTEQITSGTLRLEDGCLILTDRGRAIVKFTSFYRRHFLPRRRILMGEETAQLTDPFRNQPQRVDVACPQRSRG